MENQNKQEEEKQPQDKKLEKPEDSGWAVYNEYELDI